MRHYGAYKGAGYCGPHDHEFCYCDQARRLKRRERQRARREIRRELEEV